MHWHLLTGHRPFLRKCGGLGRKAILRKFPNCPSIAFVIEQARIKGLLMFNLFRKLVGYYLVRETGDRKTQLPTWCFLTFAVSKFLSNQKLFFLLLTAFDSQSRTLVDGSNGTRDGRETYFMEEIGLRGVWGFRGRVRTDYKGREWGFFRLELYLKTTKRAAACIQTFSPPLQTLVLRELS